MSQCINAKSGRPKVKYLTRRYAKAARLPGRGERVYRRGACGFFHIGHHPAGATRAQLRQRGDSA